MSPEKAINDFLVQGDNLSTAMEMSKYVEQLQLDMHKLFWSSFNTYMDQKIIGSESTSKWKFSSFNTRRIRKDWEKSRIIFAPIGERNEPQLQFIFGQGGKEGGFSLFWGVCWNVVPNNFFSSVLTTLSATLVARNIAIPSSPNWIYWGWYKYRIYDADFLIRCYLETDGLIKEIVDDVWSLFLELHPLLEKINLEIGPNT